MNKKISLLFSIIPFLCYIAIAAEVTKEVKIKLFFPRDGKQNPQGKIDGVTPNWYYYWQQVCNYNVGYSTYNPYGYTNWLTQKAYIGPLACTISYYGEKYIDCFAAVAIYELKHLSDAQYNWANFNNWKPPISDDPDEDWICTTVEIAEGTDPNRFDTFPNDNLPDDREYRANQAERGVDADDKQDWAHPGSQWP